MAIAFVREQTSAPAAGNPRTVTLTVTPGAGNLLIVCLTMTSTTINVTSITGCGATWAAADDNFNNTGVRGHLWYGYNCDGINNVITINLSSTSGPAIDVTEWSGARTDATVYASDKLNNSGSSTGPATASLTPSDPLGLVFAAIVAANTPTVSAGPTGGFSALTRIATSAATAESANAYLASPGASAVSTGETLSSSQAWNTCIASFRAAALRINPTGISRTPSVGLPSVSKPAHINPAGIARAPTVGLPRVGIPRYIKPTGITRTPSVGLPTVRLQPPPPWPTLIVELGLAANVFDPISGIAWTPITDYVEEFDVYHGVDHELDRAEPGEGFLRLRNIDRRFDPSNTSSPYAGSLLPMRRFRIRATWGGTTYGVACGYVKTFQPSWPDAMHSDVVLPLSDVLYVANLWPISNTAYRDLQTATANIAHYWRFGEPPGSGSAADAVGSSTGAYREVCKLGQVGAPVTEENTAVDLGDFSGWVDLGTSPAIVGTGDFTAKAWVKLGSYDADPGGLDPSIFLQQSGTNFAVAWALASVQTTGQLQMYVGASKLVAHAGVPLNDEWHQVGCKRTSSGGNETLTIYLDGKPLDWQQFAGVTSVASGRLGFGGWVFGPLMNGQGDEAVIVARGISDAEMLADYKMGRGMWEGQTTGARIAAVATAIGIPSADTSIDTGITVLQPVTESLVETMAFEHMATVADTGAGRLYADRDGKLTFHDRMHTLVAPYTTSTATFGEGTGEYHYVEGSAEVAPEEADLYTQARAQRNGGAPQTITASTVTVYGYRRLDKTDLLSASDDDAYQRALWDVEHYGFPQQRVRKIALNPVVDGSLWVQALGRRVQDRITVKARPAGGGPVFSQDCHIERIHHHYVAQESWTVEFSTSVVDPYSYWSLGSSQLGSSTMLAY